MGMPPSPDAGAFRRLDQVAVCRLLRVDQSDIAVICLGLLRQQLKDAGRARHGHDNAVRLLADLGDGLGEVLVQRQEGDQCAQRQAAPAAQTEQRAHHGTEHIADIAEVGVHRHHDVGEAVCLLCALAQLLVDPAELLQALVLVAEDLDYLFALHHLLNIAVDGAEVLLLPGEIVPGAAGELGGDQQHHRHHDQRDHRQRQAEDQHADKGDDDGDGGVDDLRNALADELAQGVHVVGVDRHDVAVGVGVKVFDGQGLHLVEQVVPQVAQGALTHIDHDAVIAEGGDHARPHDAHQLLDVLGQAGEVPGAGGQHGLDIFVDQSLGEGGPHHSAYGGHQNAPDDENKQILIVVEHVAQNPVQNSRTGPPSLICVHRCPSSHAGWSKSPPPLIWDS